MKTGLKSVVACLALGVGAIGSAHAAIVITEVDPGGSGSTVSADWFELTNTGSSAVDITGWRMDDNSDSRANSVALTGLTSIAPGQSAIFAETSGPVTAAVAFANFVSTWFGGSAPVGFAFGTYAGSGVGLSTTTDAVNIFDATSSTTPVARVGFNASSATATFDNSSGANNVTLATYSALGVNGAFLSSDLRVGSPGSVSAVPLPAGVWLLGSALGLVGAARRRRAAKLSC